MSEHREWDMHGSKELEILRNEHNATVRAYRDAMAECDRLGKANDDACDRIAELERESETQKTAWQAAVKSHGESLDKIAQAGAEIAWRKQDGDTVLEVLNPIFQNSKPYTRFCRAGEHLVRGVPRLIDEYESLKAKNSELQSWRQETLDENNRLDRELDEARQSLKALESRPVLTWEECEEEFYHVCGHFPNSSQGSFMGWLKSRLPAPTDSIRVPFSDEQIERMAKAARRVLLGSSETDANWPLWYSAIRAALAAGGLEPCAVPEYKPEDVALNSRVPALERQIYDLIAERDAARREVAEVRRHISVTMSREHSARVEAQTAQRRVAELEAERDYACTKCGCRTQSAAVRQPVDPDAWKTPLDLQYSPDCCVQFHANDIGFYVTTTLRGKLCYGNMGAIPPADAASLALWLASYAAAHGCPVIASQSDILLAQIPDKDMTVGVCVTLLESTRKNLDRATRALVRAGFQDHGGEDWKPPIGPEPHWHYAGPTRAEAEALARELREAHAKHYGGVPESYMFDGFLDEARAAFAHIGAPKRPDGMPSVEELAKIVRRHYSVEAWDSVTAEAILTALRPWLREPTGWELDVTADEIAVAARKGAISADWQSKNESLDLERCMAPAILDLCRSRIRPTFECAECAKNKSERDVMYRDLDDCRNRMLAVRLALNEGSES